jgi:hypothetical protein
MENNNNGTAEQQDSESHATIQTLIGNEWQDCDSKTWHELKSQGWEFEYLEPTKEGGVVCMSRNGYLNLFRMKQSEVKK